MIDGLSMYVRIAETHMGSHCFVLRAEVDGV